MKTFRDLFRRAITCENLGNPNESFTEFPFDWYFIPLSTINTAVLCKANDTTFYRVKFLQDDKVIIDTGICKSPYDRNEFFYEESGIQWNSFNVFNYDDPISIIFEK